MSDTYSENAGEASEGYATGYETGYDGGDTGYDTGEQTEDEDVMVSLEGSLEVESEYVGLDELVAEGLDVSEAGESSDLVA